MSKKNTIGVDHQRGIVLTSRDDPGHVNRPEFPGGSIL